MNYLKARRNMIEKQLRANGVTNALILKANYQIQSKNLELTQKNLLIASQNFEAGQSGKVDVLRFRSELSKNVQVKVESINQLQYIIEHNINLNRIEND